MMFNFGVACTGKQWFRTLLWLMYKVARETNEELRAIKADPTEAFDVGAILSIARRCSFSNLGKWMLFNLKIPDIGK